jgi:hypothetical protein
MALAGDLVETVHNSECQFYEFVAGYNAAHPGKPFPVPLAQNYYIQRVAGAEAEQPGFLIMKDLTAVGDMASMIDGLTQAQVCGSPSFFLALLSVYIVKIDYWNLNI